MDIKQTTKTNDNKGLTILAINKPRGIICTHNDEKNRKKIYDLVPRNISKKIKGDLHSVGRLDFNSQGLILLTSDGDIVNKILRARNKHEKVYEVRVNKPITKDFIKKMGNGIPILDTVTKKCHIKQTK